MNKKLNILLQYNFNGNIYTYVFELQTFGTFICFPSKDSKIMNEFWTRATYKEFSLSLSEFSENRIRIVIARPYNQKYSLVLSQATERLKYWTGLILRYKYCAASDKLKLVNQK